MTRSCPLVLSLALSVPLLADAVSLKPPATPKKHVRETLHGIELVDPYRWLEDQWSGQTRAWIESQNAHTRATLDALPGREALQKRLHELLGVETVGLPEARAGRYFFPKRHAGQDQAVIIMREGLAGPEQVLIDPHPWSPDHTTSVLLLDVSADGDQILYGVREGGQDEIVVRRFDVAARRDLPGALPRARYNGLALGPDKKRIYYGRHSQETGPRVFVHEVGTPPASDRELFGRGYGPEKSIEVSLSDEGRWLQMVVFHGSAADKTEVYVQDIRRGGPVVTVVSDVAARFLPEVAGGHVFLHTNWKAPRGRVLAVDLADAARERWREVVPEAPASIESVSAVGGRLLVEYLENVASRVKVFEPDGRPAGEIPLPALGTVGGPSGRWDGDEVFYSFQSFHLPPAIYRYDTATGAQRLWSRTEAPFESGSFEVRQDWYPSKDGTRVPIFLVHRKGLPRNASNPTLLTGYGGFNIARTPAWSAWTATWIEKGGLYALPGLRGGGEFGEEWHRAGMGEKKQNVFDDFLAAAEWLVAQRYTRPERLAISGRSNGGLLVGAAITQRPELFAAAICGYPLLDMVRYHRFLVARFWVPEYGSAEDPDQFRYLLAYSPYHRVGNGTPYPAVLFVTGDADTRVDPLHARKMAALLQDATGSGEPVLLRYDTKAGHSSGLPVAKQVEDIADEIAFLLWQTEALQPPAAKAAARWPLRTAPSMVAGRPVSVQSPAR